MILILPGQRGAKGGPITCTRHVIKPWAGGGGGACIKGYSPCFSTISSVPFQCTVSLLISMVTHIERLAVEKYIVKVSGRTEYFFKTDVILPAYTVSPL